MYVYIYIVFQNKIVGNLQNDHYFVEFSFCTQSTNHARGFAFEVKQSDAMCHCACASRNKNGKKYLITIIIMKNHHFLTILGHHFLLESLTSIQNKIVLRFGTRCDSIIAVNIMYIYIYIYIYTVSETD